MAAQWARTHPDDLSLSSSNTHTEREIDGKFVLLFYIHVRFFFTVFFVLDVIFLIKFTKESNLRNVYMNEITCVYY